MTARSRNPFSRERRARRRRHRRSRGNRTRLVVLGAVAVLGLFGVVAALQLRAARADLLIARSELERLAGDLGAAQTHDGRARLLGLTEDAVRRTRRARSSIRGSAPLQMIGVMPGFATQRTGLVRAADVAASAAAVAADLAAGANRHVDAVTLRGGSVDLRALRTFAGDAQRAGKRINALPRTHRGGQWSPLARATRELDRVVGDAGERLATGANTLRATAGFLGESGPRRYLLAVQNNAEMRDQGMVLSYAVADVTDGHLHVVRSGRTTELELPKAVTDLTLSPGTKSVFGPQKPLQLWQAVNAWADSDLSARAMMSMYRAATGERVDGVIAFDVPALAALLRVTGPVTVPGIPEPVSGDNATQLLLDELYKRDPTTAQSERREQLADVAAAVTARLESATVDSAGLADALGNAAAGGHLRITSGRRFEQRAFVASGLGGGPAARHPERTIHLSVQNGTATKLDYYVKPRVAFEVALTPEGSAIVDATVTVENHAPVPTPAGYQFGPDGLVQRAAGQYKGRVYFWSPRGSEQLDGVDDSGLKLAWSGVDVSPGASAAAHFTSVIPGAVRDGVLRLRFVPQPRLSAIPITISVGGIGRQVRSSPNVPPTWDRVLDLRWTVTDPR